MVAEVVAGILAGAAILGALAAIGKAVWWLWRKVLQPLAQLVEDWQGEAERPGISPERPGVLKRLTSIEDLQRAFVSRMDMHDARIAALEAQLRTNGKSERPAVEASGALNAERSYQDETEVVQLGFQP